MIIAKSVPAPMFEIERDNKDSIILRHWGFVQRKYLNLILVNQLLFGLGICQLFCTIYFLSRNFLSGASKYLKVRYGVHMFVFDTIGE